MRVMAGYLGKTGYRLPTEAEQEYACRAGSETPLSFGIAMDLLGKYAWTTENIVGQSASVAAFRPNDLGLFDMHGTFTWEWCQDSYVEDWPPQLLPASAGSTVGFVVPPPLGQGLMGFLVSPLGPRMIPHPNAWTSPNWPPLRPALRGARPVEDKEDLESISDTNIRRLWCGSASHRFGNTPETLFSMNGFRPARTFR
jgi:hypothetical protein